MALANTLYVTRDGFAGALRKEGCYVLITHISGRDRIELEYAYFDEDTGERLDVRLTIFTPDLDGPNYLKQGYQHLKSLEEFDEATDCDGISG